MLVNSTDSICLQYSSFALYALSWYCNLSLNHVVTLFYGVDYLWCCLRGILGFDLIYMSISWVAKSPPALLTVLLSLVLHLWFALFCFNNWALCSTMTFNWQFSYDWSSLGNCFWGLGGKIVDWLEDRGYVSYLFIWSIQKGLIKFHREIENHNLPGFYELGIK
jgi:hypothetical protein